MDAATRQRRSTRSWGARRPPSSNDASQSPARLSPQPHRSRPASTPHATRDVSALRTLILGVGNADRGDDAAGLIAARRLRAVVPAGIVVQEASGEATALLAAWDGFARVIVIDAARGAAVPGRVTRFDAVAAPLPAALARGSTHGWGVAEAIELARALGRLPPSLVVYAVEGRSFERGAALSPEVEAGIDRLAAALAAEAA